MDKRTADQRLATISKLDKKIEFTFCDVDFVDLVVAVRTFVSDIETYTDGYVLPDVYVLALAFLGHFDTQTPFNQRSAFYLSKRLSACLTKYVKVTYTSQFKWSTLSKREKHAANLHPLLARLLADTSDKDMWIKHKMFHQLASTIEDWYLNALIYNDKPLSDPHYLKSLSYDFEQVHLGERFQFPIET